MVLRGLAVDKHKSMMVTESVKEREKMKSVWKKTTFTMQYYRTIFSYSVNFMVKKRLKNLL
jgi:hypothetical protein